MSKISEDEIEPLRRNQKAGEIPEITTFQRLMPQVNNHFFHFFSFCHLPLHF